MPLKIFFADDDPDDLDLLQEGLQSIVPGHTLNYKSDCEDIVSAVKEFHPDLIFLHLNMPKYSG